MLLDTNINYFSVWQWGESKIVTITSLYCRIWLFWFLQIPLCTIGCLEVWFDAILNCWVNCYRLSSLAASSCTDVDDESVCKCNKVQNNKTVWSQTSREKQGFDFAFLESFSKQVNFSILNQVFSSQNLKDVNIYIYYNS